jgi:hypothetical protein
MDKSETKREFDLFIDRCIWTYECWRMNQLISEYQVEDPTQIWARFGSIMRFYVFSTIARINDPAGNKKNTNISLAYIAKNCINTISYINSYKNFCEENAEFIQAVKKVRDKVTSHNDLLTYKSGKLLGGFSHGLDETYFEYLHKIISLGCIELGLDPFPEWPDFIENDVKGFMDKFNKVFST